MGHHHHHEDHSSSLTFEEKLIKRLEHWVHHNDDHAATYLDWAGRAREQGLEAVAAFLEQAARQTDEVSATFREAIGAVDRP